MIFFHWQWASYFSSFAASQDNPVGQVAGVGSVRLTADHSQVRIWSVLHYPATDPWIRKDVAEQDKEEIADFFI